MFAITVTTTAVVVVCCSHKFLNLFFSPTLGLETTVLGLEFRVRQRHFKKGDMKLKV